MKYKHILFFALAVLTACSDVTQTGTTGHTMSSARPRIPDSFVRVSFAQLPGWADDDVRYALQAFRNTCRAHMSYHGRVVPDPVLLSEKCQVLPAPNASVGTVRTWFQTNFQPYRIVNDNGTTTGVFTGYYSPVVSACRTQTAQCNEPIMGVPTDGRNFKNVPRKTIVQNRIGKILYWANIVDVQDLQTQGSGAIKLDNGEMVKLNFAGTNDMTYNGPGAQLRSRGITPPGGLTASGVNNYLRANPSLAQTIINNNPRYVYFRAASVNDVVGKMGVPLTDIRSIAMDDTLYTLGMPVFIDTRLTDGRKFQRLMVAQDTGSAIKGFVRADIYFGTGANAFDYAHSQYSSGSAYILMPKEYNGN